MIDAVIRNLVSNAIKFTGAGGTVEISSQSTNNLVEIAVSDTGAGISEENMEKLFRIDVKHISIGTAGEKGSGLGLLLCKELIEKNGGKIKVESEEGKGTTFRFTLPVAGSR
jgi:signal transduction histidine kinase